MTPSSTSPPPRPITRAAWIAAMLTAAPALGLLCWLIANVAGFGWGLVTMGAAAAGAQQIQRHLEHKTPPPATDPSPADAEDLAPATVPASN